jgi:serine/threonine protein kinase
MPDDFQRETLMVVLQRLTAQLPPNLDPTDLRQFLSRHCDWEQEFPDPEQRAAFAERIYRELLGKIQTVGVTVDQELCPQCGRDFPANSPSAPAVCCSVCGFQSKALFSVAATEGSAIREAEKLPERFELKARVGEGSFGIVYRAWDSKLQRDVAIKIPKVQRLKRDVFLREARAASRLSHPNIVRIYDVGEIGDQTFIVSDFITGSTLGRWAASTKPNIRTACQVMLKIAQAIEHAHQADVIHRDLKPGNILIDQRLEPVVLDFGLSHSRTLQFESIAKPGSPVGTPAFMSPEQVQGRLDRIDTWTDVYGMGVILYQLATGTLPYTGASEDIYEEIVNGPVVSPRKRNPKISPAMDAIILKAMEKSPERRYATAHEFAEDLRRYLAGETVSAYRQLDARVLISLGRRYSLLALAVVLTGGLFGVWALWRSEHQANHPIVAVTINTEPAEAQLTWIRLDLATAAWDDESSSQSHGGAVTRLPPGFYKVIARAGKEWFEVYRTVPAPEQSPTIDHLGIGRLPHRSWRAIPGGYELPRVKVPPVEAVADGMAFIAGGHIEFGMQPQYPAVIRGEKRSLPPFLVDRHEVTSEAVLDVFGDYQSAAVDDLQAPAEMIDWDLAVAYAEAVGKNIPTLWELLFVATQGGTTRFPWGDEFPDTPEGPALWARLAEMDRTSGESSVHGLVMGVAEWTVDRREPVRLPGTATILVPADPNQFYAVGWDHLAEFPAEMIRGIELPPFYSADGRRRWPGLGFRCVRRLSE